MLKKRSSTGSLLKSSPISSTAKVKTAEVRHLISPQNFPYVKGNIKEFVLNYFFILKNLAPKHFETIKQDS